jgi:hypothetical protein
LTFSIFAPENCFDRVERRLHDLRAAATAELGVRPRRGAQELLLELLGHLAAGPRAVALAELLHVALGGLARVVGVVAAARGDAREHEQAGEQGDAAHGRNASAPAWRGPAFES